MKLFLVQYSYLNWFLVRAESEEQAIDSYLEDRKQAGCRNCCGEDLEREYVQAIPVVFPEGKHVVLIPGGE